MEYRPIPDGRSEEFRRLVSYAFSPESGPGLEDEEKPHPGERYGLFDGESLLCVCRHYFLDARVRGEQMLTGLQKIAGKFPQIGDVRGLGLMAGIWWDFGEGAPR